MISSRILPPRASSDAGLEALAEKDVLPRARSLPPQALLREVPLVAVPERQKTAHARLWLVAGAFVALAALGAFRIVRAGTETTDHATVAARVTSIAAESSGIVAEVLVEDHAVVDKGAPLLRLAAAAVDAKMAAARASLASAEAALAAARTRANVVGRQVDTTTVVARGDETAARARQKLLEAEAARAQAAADAATIASDLATRELERVRTLHAQRVVSDAQVDEARARAAQAEAEARRARALVLATTAERTAALGLGEAASGRVKLTTSGAEVDLARTDVELAAARVAEAKAALDLVELERKRAVVTAPARGIVEKRRVAAGTFVTPGSELLLLVSTDDVWVDAEFKESQIGKIAPGQAADVELDAHAGVRLAGHVESVGGATVARTSLLQASGNGFARTTQRVPVRIALDRRPEVPLAAGLNATVTVRVGSK